MESEEEPQLFARASFSEFFCGIAAPGRLELDKDEEDGQPRYQYAAFPLGPAKVPSNANTITISTCAVKIATTIRLILLSAMDTFVGGNALFWLCLVSDPV